MASISASGDASRTSNERSELSRSASLVGIEAFFISKNGDFNAIFYLSNMLHNPKTYVFHNLNFMRLSGGDTNIGNIAQVRRKVNTIRQRDFFTPTKCAISA